MTDTLTFPAVPQVAMATRRGVRDHNMDAAASFAASTGLVAVAVVDGIGNDQAGAQTMTELARIAVRIGVTKGPLAGILTAAAYIDDPGTETYKPNAVAVLAIAEPGEPTLLGWVGDSHAYGWDGTTLHRRTNPHTMGAFLRWNGDNELAPEHDNWVRLSLVKATPTTVALSEIPADELVLLVSDGIDSVGDDELRALVMRHQHDPQALADAIVAAAREDEDGYRDDATAVVLMPADAALYSD
ncbi:PP2C family serine/threonine-protein phosphatase [Kutzneria chonburiensis]|uniref:PPM-type phosphatase domain-containing protein n=1 Tax=Kutzneria chonburiensis TaxID=1483604 RepID=A0ABV6N2P8_9PSEU|nr:PP2C family serine/threonine-protein phosphatase [Kutzneria chonburiensis]